MRNDFTLASFLGISSKKRATEGGSITPTQEVEASLASLFVPDVQAPIAWRLEHAPVPARYRVVAFFVFGREV